MSSAPMVRFFLTLLAGLTFLPNLAYGGAVPTGQVLNFGNADEPKDLDPQIVAGIPEFHILMNLFEPLVGKNPKTLDPIPAAAESWTISKDHKVYTFKLRKNAKWTNGDPVTAHDFVYAWTRLLAPATAAEYASMGYFFKNGKAFNTGKLKDAAQLGFRALNPYTLQVTLESSTPFFLSLLFHTSLLPVHKSTLEKFGPKWTRPENMVSNGPFMLTRWELNKIITLKKSPTYWDHDKVTLTEVNFHPVQSGDTEEKMFRAKELDITDGVPLERDPLLATREERLLPTGAVARNVFLLVQHKAKAPGQQARPTGAESRD